MLKASLREIRQRFAQAEIAGVDAELLAAHVLESRGCNYIRRH
jgi:hypothetical protein